MLSKIKPIIMPIYWSLILSEMVLCCLVLLQSDDGIYFIMLPLTAIFILVFLYIEIIKNDISITILQPDNPNIPGYVYVMKRADGILKIGYSVDINNRELAHKKDYRQEFKTIVTFFVPNMARYEGIALFLTKQYHFCEGHRKELRKMNEAELKNFLDEFQEICIKDLIKR